MRSALLVALLLTLSAAPAAHGQAADESADAKQAPYREAQTGLLFPQEVGKLKLAKTHVFDEKRLGVAVRYKLDDKATIDTFIYNNGRDAISSDPNDPALTAELDNTLLSMQKPFPGLAVDDRSIVPLAKGADAPQALRLVCSFGPQDKRFATGVYLVGYKNHFVKLRATWIPTPDDETLRLLDDFAKWLGGEMAGTSEK